MVPNGWNEGRVKNLVKSLDAGVSVNSEDDGNTEAKYKILKTSCVSKGIFDSSKTKSVVESNEVSRLKEPVVADTIIISRMNTPALVGANGYISHAIKNTFLPDRLWQAKPKNKSIHMRWLGYWFSSSHARYALSATATGTSGSMKNITKPDVLNIRIDVPPLPEQQKIAKILSTWDKAISTTEALIDNSKQQKKALMQQLLTGKKRFAGFDGEWENGVISDYITFSGGAQPPRSTFIDNEKVGYIRLVQIRDYKSDKFITYIPKDKARKFCSASDVMIGRYGPPIFQILRGIKGAYNVALIKAIPSTDLYLEFMYYFLCLEPLFEYIESFSRRTSGQTGIEMDRLKEYTFNLPSYEEQQKIATVLTNADKEIELLEQQLADLKQEKKALMQQLLTGKRRVKIDGVKAA